MDDTGDVEGGIANPAKKGERQRSNRRVLRWDGAEDGAIPTRVQAIRAGDVVVLSAAAGGYDAHGWAPRSTDPVPDLAETATERRLGHRVRQIAGEALDEAAVETAFGERGIELDEATGLRITFWERGAVVHLVSRRTGAVSDPYREVRLGAHQARVAARAGRMAEELALDARSLRLGGTHHDDGKADLRWQAMAHGGDLARAVAGPPLAKGSFARRAWPPLPPGWRHERESLRRLDASGALAELEPEVRDLVRWLVATHHGHARPLWPQGGGDDPQDWRQPVLQAQLESRMGPWRLALHEAVLRLADWVVSREEAEGLHAAADETASETASKARPGMTDGARAAASGTIFRPNLDPLNLRDVMAAIGLTRILSETGDGTTTWRREGSIPTLRFVVMGVPEALPELCATWVRENGPAFDYAALENTKDIGPDRWREEAQRKNGLRAALWSAIGSDGVPHEAGGKRDWQRIAAPRLEYAQGAGHVNWLQSMAAFLGNVSAKIAVRLSGEDFARVLEGRAMPSLSKSEWEALPRGDMPKPGKLAQCRWDFACARDHATRHMAPAADELLQDQTLNALAAIGLAACPSAPTKQGLATPLVVGGDGREARLAWPLWTEPLRIEAIEAALAIGLDVWGAWPVVQSRRHYVGKALVFGRGELSA